MHWLHAPALTEYPHAHAAMQARARAIAEGRAEELVWLLEHPPLYTAGTSAREEDLLHAHFPVHHTGRGGQFTYHGPGQRVAYCLLNLRARYGGTPDLRDYVHRLEQWLINSIHYVGLHGRVYSERVGVWVDTPTGEAKIAAIGIRIQRGVSLHGIALNIHPNLSHFGGIVPCGIAQHGVTSLQALGIDITMTEMDTLLQQEWAALFGE